ncbi:hypothetical protein GCM10020331_016490 [Ectobacillus funiculus]
MLNGRRVFLQAEAVEGRNVFITDISKELGIARKYVASVINLTEEGNTVPFIARYRKEMTGSLDEVQIRTILEKWQYIVNLEARKAEVLRLIEEKKES